MAYDHKLELQRAVFISALGGAPALSLLSHLELMFLYLGDSGFTQGSLLDRLYAWSVANGIPMPQALTSVGLVGPQLWTPGNLVNPPHIAIDADRTNLLTKDGSNVLTSLTTVYGALASNTPVGITHASNAALNGFNSFNCPGTGAQQINFSTAAGSLLNGKAGCTMIFFGKFRDAAPTPFNSAIINATTTSASAARASIGTSPTVANCPRYVIRRLDADTSNGDDIGVANIGLAPWIGIMRLDHNGAVVGAGTPTKEMRVTQSGVLTTASEATGLGAGNFSATNSAYIGFFNSGGVAESIVQGNYCAIEDTVYTDDEVLRLEGWLAHKIDMASTILPPTHPYFTDPPLAD